MNRLRTLLCALLIGMGAQAQQSYQNLVFEGGGIRGIAYGGVLLELEDRHMLDSVQRVGGTSVGAIQAPMLSVGYTPEEIISIIGNSNFKRFADGRGFFIGGTRRTMKYYGWYRGDKFNKWMGNLLSAKTSNSDLTFGELHALTKHRPNHRDLYITATNLTMQRVEVFSHETYPDMKIRDAVRISMSIPLYFRAVFMTPDGHIVEKPKSTRGLYVMVDGGITSNYPIHLFDQQQYLPNGIAGDTAFALNPSTLGIRLERMEQIPYDESGQGLAPYEIDGFTDYIGAFYNLVIEELNRKELTAEDWDRTVMVSCAGIGPKIKRMSGDEKQLLINSGRNGVRKFLAS